MRDFQILWWGRESSSGLQDKKPLFREGKNLFTLLNSTILHSQSYLLKFYFGKRFSCIPWAKLSVE